MGTSILDAIFYALRDCIDVNLKKEFPQDNAETSAAWNALDEIIVATVPDARVEEFYEAVQEYSSAAALLAFRNGVRFAAQFREESAGREAP